MHLSLISARPVSVAIYDMSGKLNLVQKARKEKTTLDVSSLSAGMYFIELTDNSGKSSRMKFVKE